MKKGMVIGIIIAIVVIIGIFALTGNNDQTIDDNTVEPEITDDSSEGTIEEEQEAPETEEPAETPEDNENDGPPAWMDVALTDVTTQETFTISQYIGTPILIESFAVWCPICTSQQENIHELKETDPDLFVSIALNTDSSEDEQKVLNHINNNGFDGHYAVSPIELTQMLIDEFGNGVVSAPSVPLILVCEDGSFRKLGGFGARSADTIKSEIAAGC